MLSREYGCQAAYTPMYHGLSFATSKKYRQKNFSTCPEDRPLLVQFCANNADILVQAAKHVEYSCDGIDINLGCPQNIARRGHYGAFLQDEWELIDEMVSKLRNNLRGDIGVSCKIRRFDDLNKTVDYARMLEKAGCTFIGIHARTREQRGTNSGLADWNYIKAVKENVNIPVIANGNILSLDDANECLDYTKADAIMTAEGNLYNPALFLNVYPPAWKVAKRYLHYVRKYPVPLGMAKSHIFKLFHRCLGIDSDNAFQIQLGRSNSLEQIDDFIAMVEKRFGDKDCDLTIPISYLPVPPYLCQPRYRYDVKPSSNEQTASKLVNDCSLASVDGVEKRIKLTA
jgi:tRNA-dihydrouridine synthase 1